MPQLYTWDELDSVIRLVEDADAQREMNIEGGWEYHHLLPNGVAVLRTDRHWALECFADSPHDAQEKFMQFEPFAKSFEEDSN